MTEGISVKLPVTSHAIAIPAADSPRALVVAITANGSTYFGTHHIRVETLAAQLRSELSNRNQKDTYIKSDVRAPYASVEEVVSAMRGAGLESTMLLTAQQQLSPAATPVPPQALNVTIGKPYPSAAQAVVVQLLPSRQASPELTINHQPLAWDKLESGLQQHFHNRSSRVVLLKADGSLPFADVVSAIDRCRAVGAAVVLATPRL
jgi:biopolymer transport protein ExbD